MIEVRPRSLRGVERTHGRLRQALLSAPTLVSVLLAASVIARILMARHVLAPWAMGDELRHSELANSFVATRHYVLREQPYHLPSIYPALISPAWLADSMKTTYALAKGFNVALMTAAAIPLYAWARRLVRPAYAILAVGVYLAIPSFVYTAELLTENAYVPAVVLALLVLALALERPTIPRQLLALALAALVVAIRVQGIVFAAIIPTAIGLKVLFDLRAAAPASKRAVLRQTASRWSLPLGLLVLAAVVYAAYEQLRGASLSSGLGIYSAIAHSHYTLQDSARWVTYHFGELAFSVGAIPFSALVLLVGLAFTPTGTPRPVERAFVAVAAASVFWTVVETGVYATVEQFRIEERYMVNVVPVLLLALVVWLDRGLPRPPGLAAAAALLPIALFLAIPYTGFFRAGLDNSTFGLIPLVELTDQLGDVADTQLLVGAGMLLAGLLFASVPREVARVAIPVVLLAFFTASTRSVFQRVEVLSTNARHAGGLQGDPSWVDHAIGRNARAEFLYTTAIDSDPHMVWQTEFWNESVRRVIAVASRDPSLPNVDASFDPGTGRIAANVGRDSPDRVPRYTVSAYGVEVAGRRLARNGFLVLYRVSPPLRLASVATGLYTDGWTGPSAAYTRYVMPRGATHVEIRVNRHGVKGVAPAKVHVVVGPVLLACGVVANPGTWAHQTSTVEAGAGHVFRLPVRGAPFQVRLTVDPTFSPAEYGSPDARQLGVRVAFSVRRRQAGIRREDVPHLSGLGRPLQHCRGHTKGGHIASTN